MAEVTEPDVYGIHMPDLEEKFAAIYVIERTFKEIPSEWNKRNRGTDSIEKMVVSSVHIKLCELRLHIFIATWRAGTASICIRYVCVVPNEKAEGRPAKVL